MDREEYNEWRARRGDEPGAFIEVHQYIMDVYPTNEWRAREVEFVEEVEAQAKEVYEDRRARGLDDERGLIDDHVEEQQDQYQRVLREQKGFEVIATEIRLSYGDCEGRVVEDLEVVRRGDPDGPEGLLVLRPGGKAYRLEPTVRLLESYEMPTNVLMHYSFEVLQVSDEDTWEDVAAMVEEQVELLKESTQEAHRELKFLRARRDVYDALLERRTKGKSMPWEARNESTTDTATAEDIMRAFQKSGIEECESWNAKGDLTDWAVRTVEPTPSPSTVKRRLKDIGVWIKGKQGVRGSGLKETVQEMKTYIESD